jgi:hypothetical protein
MIAAVCEMARSTMDILMLLTEATTDLFWVTETDAPFEVEAWSDLTTDSLTEKDLLQWLKCRKGTAINRLSLTDFFQPVITPEDWHGDEEKATIAKYETLSHVLAENLQDVQVYRLGTINIQIYIVGKTPEGEWVAIATEAVET